MPTPARRSTFWLGLIVLLGAGAVRAEGDCAQQAPNSRPRHTLRPAPTAAPAQPSTAGVPSPQVARVQPRSAQGEKAPEAQATWAARPGPTFPRVAACLESR